MFSNQPVKVSESPSVTENSKKASFSHQVTFYDFKSELPWNHSAALAGTKYLSIHPITHFKPPMMNPFHDPDDTATKVIEIWQNVIQPMVYIDMAFGESEQELAEYVYSKVDVPVTEEQFKKAQAMIDRQIERGVSGDDKYSIFKFAGDSCTEGAQEVLEAITDGSAEARLAKRHFVERFVAWPPSTFHRADEVAKARNFPEQNIARNNSSSRLGLFGQTYFNTLKKNVETHHEMDIERMTYF